MNHWALIACALGGTLFGSLLACIPALHIYNVAGLLLLILAPIDSLLPTQGLAMLLLGMVVGYACVNALPALFFAAPDESATWLVLPGQRYL